MGDTTAKTALFETFASVGKALANSKRLELVDLLAQGERSVEALASAAGLGLTTASNHLQVLRQAGLVATRKEGTKVFYRLAGTDVAALWAQLRAVAAAHLAETERARTAYLGADDAEQVTREQLLERIQAGGVTVIDVRPAAEYAAGHIPGAVSVPLDELADRLADLPADGQIVAYCRGAYCVMAHEAVRALTARGRRAARLAEGMLEWRLAELPVAS
ncbi:ArsR/SmtB family transcription factor [Planomonospora venezuelensis]|uniref:Rhodanese-related sulfurtransferase n=1 Tax=Planomonospora venezuelensis TaxID=1999 RepID=A0A841D9A9_PLAVE|nr:metalloregulator ArsR/SmtB family transcription factor [Planomonospora venezuelensis]MBB5967212.1 rhodanese-related sulfurtransferase [Planomonospora venezuelensis]GIN02983.1 ArsR family transcriptional regulator [Planomonospora venezuelensis]